MAFTCDACGQPQAYTNGTSTCYPCVFWQTWVADRDRPYAVRVGGHHYSIHAAPPGTPKAHKGMSGDLRTVRFFDGRTVETDNVWHQGEIPVRFRAQLPDNAEFVP